MVNAVVASTKRQAEAMIVLLKLDPTEWVPVLYGQPINNLYHHAKLVRPSEGVVKEDCDWVLQMLVPHTCMTITTIPPNWRVPQEEQQE